MSNPLLSAQSFPREPSTGGAAATLSTTLARGGDAKAATEPPQLAPTEDAETQLSALAPLARLVARRAARQHLRVRKGYTIIQIPVALAVVALLLLAALMLSRMLGR